MSASLLFIVASLREGSLNAQLARHAERLVAGRAQVGYLDYADVPLMNQDVEYPAPPAVARVRAEVMSADGIWIFSPEYNHQVPGTLKNLLDWLSRPLVEGDRGGATAIEGTPVTFCSAAGRSAGAGCLSQLDALLTVIGARVMAEGAVGVAMGAREFTTGVLELQEETRGALESQLEAFLEFIG